MKLKLFIESALLIEFSNVATLSKMVAINKGLVKVGLLNGTKSIDLLGAAWALFTAAACPYARFDKIVIWLEERKEDESKNEECQKAVFNLSRLMADKESLIRVKSVGFSPEGLVNIVFIDKISVIYPKKIAEKITSKVHKFTIVPGEVLVNISAIICQNTKEK